MTLSFCVYANMFFLFRSSGICLVFTNDEGDKLIAMNRLVPFSVELRLSIDQFIFQLAMNLIWDQELMVVLVVVAWRFLCNYA